MYTFAADFIPNEKYIVLKNFYNFLLFFFLSIIVYSVDAQDTGDTPYVVNSINLTGCTSTDSVWLKSLMSTTVGEKFNIETYESDMQRFRNLNLFFSVEGDWKVLKNNLVDIIIKIEESIYIYPQFSIGGFKDVIKLNLGLSTINWRGRGAQLGAIYQYYDRHSLSIYQSTPRHRSGNTGHTMTLSRYATVEPLYFDDIEADFNYDVYNAMIGGHYWLNYYSKFGGGTAFFYELYKNREQTIPDFPQERTIKYRKVQFFTFLENDRRDYNFEMEDGHNLRLYAEYILDLNDPKYSFYKLEAELKYYTLLDDFTQLAFRSKLGVATNRATPFLPYVIDGYLNVRGAGNRIHRGSAEFVNSLEFRHRLFNHSWFILQGVVFTDIAYIRNAEQKLYEIFNSDQNYSFGGVGIRIALQKFYRTTIRLDYSHDLSTKKGNGGLTFGIGQFF